MCLMQPKWFRRLDVAVGNLVWAQRDGGVVGGTVQAAAPAARTPDRSHADALEWISVDTTTQHTGARTSRRSAATTTPARDRRHNIGAMPAPWGVAPQQGALRGAITCHGADGRCSYSASHKSRSAANHWSCCIAIDHPGVAVQWEDTAEQYTVTRERMPLVGLIRCGRCAVGIHPACAIDYSEWPGKVGEPGGAVRQKRHPQGCAALLQVLRRVPPLRS